MTHHPSEDDFLASIYKQSATESPPKDLDEKILALAKAKHQQNRFAKTMSLQRILSVAAVMVFSIYIFFETDNHHPKQMDQESFHPPQTMLRSAPSPEQKIAPSKQQLESPGAYEDLEIAEKIDMFEQQKIKRAKPSVKKERANDFADDAIEVSSERKSSMPRLSKTQTLNQSAETGVANKAIKAENMLKDLEQLVVSGKLDEAKLVFEQFRQIYPDYPISEFIMDAMNNTESYQNTNP